MFTGVMFFLMTLLGVGAYTVHKKLEQEPQTNPEWFTVGWFSYDMHELSQDKINSIKKEAKKNEKEAWAAVMKVDEQGKLVEDIHWTNLSKQTA